MKMNLINERNKEIERMEKLVTKEMREEGVSMTRKEIIRRMCDHPVSQFYITAPMAQRKVSEILRTGKSSAKTAMRRQMYWDIHDRVVALLTANRLMTFSDAICEAIESQAPRIYLTPESMEVVMAINRRKVRGDE